MPFTLNHSSAGFRERTQFPGKVRLLQEDQQQQSPAEYLKKATKDDFTVAREYRGSLKMNCVDTSRSKSYVVRWGRYRLRGDSLEQPRRIILMP